MFERFTPEARQLVEKAAELGRSYDEIGIEDLILAMLGDESDTFARTALVNNGITYRRFKKRLPKALDEPRPHSVPMAPDYKKVLELSLREALQLGSSYIEPLHLLLAVIRHGEGVAVDIIKELGGDLNHIRRDVIQLKTQEHFMPHEPVNIPAKKARPAADILRDINNHSTAIRHLTAELELGLAESS